MTIKQRIQNDQLQARKDRDGIKSKVLTYLLGQIQQIEKDKGEEAATDEVCLKLIAKLVESNTLVVSTCELKVMTNVSMEKRNQLKKENEILLSYLPKSLTKDELIEIIDSAVSTSTAARNAILGDVMSTLRNKWPQQYDAKEAAQLVKDRLAKGD